jgi:hypothetical protein
MKIIADENGQEWSVYGLKRWSFVLLIPLLYNLLLFFLQAQLTTLQAVWQFPSTLLAIGILIFLAVNLDYIYALRLGVYANRAGKEKVTSKMTPLEIWIQRSQKTK